MKRIPGQGFLDLGSEIIVDNFAGGGGASLGIESAFGRPVDVAINHNGEAVAMHMANHPHTRHYCEDVFHVDPVEATGNQPVGLAWFSPDCKHFSKAKGGKPVSKKIRGLAWVVIRWARKVAPRVIMLENVEEFQTWGPVLENGMPCPDRKGHTFHRWVKMLKQLGYQVEWKELRACDYGAPTIRKRLFLIARRDGLPIVWPKPSHGAPDSAEVKKGKLQPWRTAAECIDWSIACPSIFERKKELAEATQRRIAKGIKRYVIEAVNPFIVQTGYGERAGQSPRVMDIKKPIGTLVGTQKHALCLPHLVGIDHQSSSSCTWDAENPLTTITTENRHALVAAHITKFRANSTGSACDDPLHTVTAGGDSKRPAGSQHAMGLVTAFLAKHYTGVVGHGVDQPAGTVTTADHHSLVTSNLIKLRGTCADGQAIEQPLPTITAGGMHIGEVRTFLMKYYGEGSQHQDMREPMHTVPTKDRFGLVTVSGEQYQIVDIGLRMLAPRELFRAQGFHDGYIIDPVVNGKRLSKSAQVRMVGNSVSPVMSEALVRANFAHEKAWMEVA